MNKKSFLNKVMIKLDAGVSMSYLNRLIESIRKMKSSDEIYKILTRTLNEHHLSKQELQELLSRFMSKEKLQKLSPAHDHALKKIMKDFGGDYHSFK